MARTRSIRAVIAQVALLTTAAYLPAAAWAQETGAPADSVATTPAASDFGDEIVVTARKRAESNLAVPVAVSAVSAEQLVRANVSDITQITNLVPQIVMARGPSGSGGTLGIRGISAAYTDAGVDSPVSIALDGAQFSRNYISQTAALDVANVQVMKGPQALFFGKNSPAGVISFSSANPGDEFEGSLRAGHEFRADQYFVEGVLSGPLNDAFGARLAVRYDDMKGYFRNLARPIANPFGDAALAPTYPGAAGNGRTPNANTISSRLTLTFNPPGEDFSANFKVLYNRYRDNEATGYMQNIFCTGGGPDDGGVLDPYDDCKPNRFRSAGQLPEEFTRGYPSSKFKSANDTILATLNMEKTFGDFTLSSLTAYFDTDIVMFGCNSHTVYCRLGGYNGEKMSSFQQEFRALSDFDSPLNVMVGAFYEYSDRRNFTYLVSPTATAPIVIDVRNGNSYASVVRETTKGETMSAFGQIIYDITDTLELTAGARFTRETKNGYFRNTERNESNPIGVAILAPVGAALFPRFADNDLSPEATLTWRMTPSQTFYAAYRTGYKSGGFSTPSVWLASTVAAGAGSIEFGSEKAKGGEIGYKAELFDRRLILDADVYYYKFSGLQRSALDIATLNFAVRNAASAVTKGAEFNASYTPLEGLNIHTNVAYNRARYKRFDTAPCYTPSAPGCTVVNGRQLLDLSGTPLSRAPDWVIAGGAKYDFPLGSSLVLGLSGDARYSDRYLTQEDGNPDGFQDSYIKYNAGVTLRDVDDRWNISLMGRNLTNKYVVLYSAAKPGSVPVPGIGPDIQGYVDRGREIVLQTSIRF